MNISGLNVVDRQNEKLGRGELAVINGNNAGGDLILEITRDAGDAVGGPRLIKALAEVGHAVGDGNYGPQRRDTMEIAEKADEVTSELSENRLNVVVARIERKDLFGLPLALLLHDLLEQLVLGVK